MRRDPITHAPLGPFTKAELADLEIYCRAIEKQQRPMMRRLKLIRFMAAIFPHRFRIVALLAIAAGAIGGAIWRFWP